MGLEAFTGRMANNYTLSNNGENGLVVPMLIELMSMVIVLVLVSTIGAYLWNNSVSKLFKGVNKSQWSDILAFTILLKIMF